MFFVGIDLAWSLKNGSGVTVISDKKFIDARVLYSDKEMLEHIDKLVGDKPAYIAIDAPLIVPNETGRREAEALVGALFRKYDAGAHPSNRQRLASWTGTIRGEELSKLLEKQGFAHNPYTKKNEKSRKFFEVFPHPSMVVLFGLNKILQYKAKPHRDYDFRWNVFKTYQDHLRKLKDADPSLFIPKNILDEDVKKLRSQSLKDYEDLLDSIFCAYIAYYSWKHPDKCAILGDMKKGYILTPINDSVKKQMAEMKSQSSLAAFK